MVPKTCSYDLQVCGIMTSSILNVSPSIVPSDTRQFNWNLFKLTLTVTNNFIEIYSGKIKFIINLIIHLLN